jgi:hypothetical protein
MRLSWAAVVGQRVEPRINRSFEGAYLISVDAIVDTADASINPDQIVRTGSVQGAINIVAIRGCAIQIAGHNRVLKSKCPGIAEDAAAQPAAADSVVADFDLFRS